MATSTTGTVPETRPADPGPSPDRPGSPGGDRPATEEASTEEIVRETQRAVREGPGSAQEPALQEAIRASEAADGARVTEARLRDGSLLAADGTAPLEARGPDAQARAADQYLSDLRERAAGTGEPLSKTEERLAYQTELVHDHLKDHYVKPDEALDKLQSLDDNGRSALAAGDATVLGETRPNASATPLNPGALVAHRDVCANHPEETARVGSARDQDRAQTSLNEIGPQGQAPETRGGPEREGPEPGSPGAPTGNPATSSSPKIEMPSLEETMQRSIMQAMGSHQI